MNNVFKKVIPILLVILLISSVFAGCAKKEDPPKEEETKEKSVSSTKEGKEDEGKGEVYPLKTDVELTYWSLLNGNVAATAADLGDTPLAEELEKRTGVKIKYLHPPSESFQEQFNLMLASDELPDIIDYLWSHTHFVPEGPDKAIKQGQIIRLNDVIDEYAPNLKKYYSLNPEIDKMSKTDKGNYFSFAFIRGDDYLTAFFGLMLRKDWLDELKLEVPTTIDEWYTVLKAFKEEKGVESPLTYEKGVLDFSHAFIGAYGIAQGLYIDDGKIKYGPVEPGYRDFLALMQKWYAEGLLDKNLATVDGKAQAAKMTGDKAGATLGFVGSRMGGWLGMMAEEDPKFDLVGAPYPVLKKGEKPEFGQKDSAINPYSCAITTKCKNVEIAARWLDYGYSEEGHMLYNFGIEGVSYKMVNGYPTYTDLIKKNPDGLPMNQAMSRYVRSCYSGPFIQDKRYFEQYLNFPQQKQAVGLWSNTEMGKHMLPGLTFTKEENEEMTSSFTDIRTFVDEMTWKFMFGVEPLDNFDEYVEKVKDMGIDKVIEIQEAALTRFNNR